MASVLKLFVSLADWSSVSDSNETESSPGKTKTTYKTYESIL